MNIQKEVEKIQETLKEDKEYREVWKANIAMAFVDEWNTNETFQQSEQQYSDVHKLANEAADRFLDSLVQ